MTSISEYQYQIMNFGRYRNISIDNILLSKFGTYDCNEKEIIKRYIKTLINFIIKEEPSKLMYLPTIKNLETYMYLDKLIELLFLPNIENPFFVDNKHIVINNEAIVHLHPHELIFSNHSKELSILIEGILNSDFTNMVLYKNKHDLNYENELILENSKLITNDYKYIIWAINNVTDFTIDPDIIKNKINHKRLLKFKTKRLNEHIFEYNPIFDTYEYEFSEETKKNNEEKFRSKSEYTSNNINNSKIYNYTDDVDWNNWNDDLDADQQDLEFWNQF